MDADPLYHVKQLFHQGSYKGAPVLLPHLSLTLSLFYSPV